MKKRSEEFVAVAEITSATADSLSSRARQLVQAVTVFKLQDGLETMGGWPISQDWHPCLGIVPKRQTHKGCPIPAQGHQLTSE